MSTFDNPFDPDRRLRAGGCSLRPACQRSRTRTCRAGAALRAVEPSEDKRYEGVVASAVMRAMFPQGRRAARLPEIGRRLDRAGRDLAILPAQDRDRSVRARRRRSRRRTSRSASSRSPARRRSSWRTAGLLFQARPQRRSDQDRRLGGDPRQDHQQGIRRRAHAVADAARDLAWASAPIAIPYTVPAIENINGQAHHACR